MKEREKLLNHFIGKEMLETYKLTGHKKFSVWELKRLELQDFVPQRFINSAQNKPEEKIFFEEDVYVVAYVKNELFLFAIGSDPDKNTFFKPYEE